MKTYISIFLSISILTLFISCTNSSPKTEIAFTETVDIFQVGNQGLLPEYDGVRITGFNLGYPIYNRDQVTRYIGDIPRATLDGAGLEAGICNDGDKHLVALDPSPDRPLLLTAQIIGDTGNEDVSDDRNCRCDSRIDEIALQGLVVFFEGGLPPLQFANFKLSGESLCPNTVDGHLVSGDREFGGSVDIFGAVVLRIAPDSSTILADVSLSMIESESRGS